MEGLEILSVAFVIIVFLIYPSLSSKVEVSYGTDVEKIQVTGSDLALNASEDLQANDESGFLKRVYELPTVDEADLSELDKTMTEVFTEEITAIANTADRTKVTMAVDENGRWAKTEWRVLREFSDRTLLDVHIITGRTHQIRVHMASMGHPVLGDVLYGHKRMPNAERLMLHAYSLEFTHPETGERLKFIAPCPFCEE